MWFVGELKKEEKINIFTKTLSPRDNNIKDNFKVNNQFEKKENIFYEKNKLKRYSKDYEILNLYFIEIEKKIPWKQIFSLFKIEFMHSKNFQATVDGVKVSLENAILNSDGSIQIENKKVFSLRWQKLFQ